MSHTPLHQATVLPLNTTPRGVLARLRLLPLKINSLASRALLCRPRARKHSSLSFSVFFLSLSLFSLSHTYTLSLVLSLSLAFSLHGL